MTIIVYREGVMAADSMISDQDMHRDGEASKIHFMTNGWIIAYAGTAGADAILTDHFQALLDPLGFFKRTNDKPTIKDSDRLEILLGSPTGQVFYSDENLELIQWSPPIYAIGAGAQIAKGALCVGANAVAAVAAAIQVSMQCGGAIQVVLYDQSEKRWRSVQAKEKAPPASSPEASGAELPNSETNQRIET